MSVYQLDHFRTDVETAKSILNDIKKDNPDLLDKDIIYCYRCKDGSIIIDAETWHGSIDFYLEPYMNDKGHPWLYVCIDNDGEAFVEDRFCKETWKKEFEIVKDSYNEYLNYPVPISIQIDYKDLLREK